MADDDAAPEAEGKKKLLKRKLQKKRLKKKPLMMQRNLKTTLTTLTMQPKKSKYDSREKDVVCYPS